VLDVQNEVLDRFGKYPLATTYLFEIMKLRVMLKKLLVRQIDCSGKTVIISFHPRTPAKPDIIIGMMKSEPRSYQFTPDYKLVCTLKDTSFEGILQTSKSVLTRLMPV